MKGLEGQISIFDIFRQQEQVENEPPIMLNIGQNLYVVEKGDVRIASVFDEKSWLCGEGDRGYRLIFESGCYGCAWNSSIGNRVFFTEKDARDKAEEYLNTHEVLRAESIRPVKTVAYTYTRSIDNMSLIAFYCELENGMVYMKEFMTFHHMIIPDKKQNAIKKFMEQQELKYSDVREIEYTPVFKNMYRIRQAYDWDYAEAGHSYAVG